MSDLVTANKVRTVVPSTTISADINLPAFPSGPNASGMLVFTGDLDGAIIDAFVTTVADPNTFTSLAINVETSNDGTNWEIWKALTTHTGAGTNRDKIVESDGRPFKYIRFALDITGTSCSFVGKVEYKQCGTRGKLAPPGMNERAH